MHHYARTIKSRIRQLQRTTVQKVRAAILPDPWASGKFGYYSVWCWDPLIIYVAQMYYPGHVQSMMQPLFETIGQETVRFFVWYTWVFESEHNISLLHAQEEEERSRYPNHRYLHLCNTERQLDLFRAAGLEAIFCNDNAMKNERVYRPLAGAERQFDAIYDARLNSFKRHELALDIPRLALIYTKYRHNFEPTYLWKIRPKLRRAHHFNLSRIGTYRDLRAEEVARCYNRCHVGLCLSAVEGASFASIQYLLCGLPVVSTRSVGGRDVFFDDETTLIVDDDPESVRDGVNEMIARRLDPRRVREVTLAKIQVHRARLIAEIQRACREEGVEYTAATASESFFECRHEQPHADIISHIKGLRAGERSK